MYIRLNNASVTVWNCWFNDMCFLTWSCDSTINVQDTGSQDFAGWLSLTSIAKEILFSFEEPTISSYVYIYIYIHAYINIYISMFLHMYTYIYIYTYMCKYSWIYTRMNVHEFTCIENSSVKWNPAIVNILYTI
jgi:hypothetical protein